MPPAIPPELPDRNDVEATWNFLERFIEKFMKDPDQNVSMEMYMNAYIVVHNFCQPVEADGLSIARRQGAPLRGEELYTLLSQYLTNHLQDVYLGSEGHSEEVFLKFYIREWDRYTTAAKFVNHLFRYLNRHWIKREIDEGKRGIYDVYTLHLVRWKEDFFMATHEKVTSGVLNLIEKQRNGQTIEHAHIKSIVEMLVCLSLDDNHSHKALGIYVFYFERPFIAATKAYWKTESQHFMTEHSVVEYIKKVESGLEKDRERVGLYLHPSTMRVYMGTSLEVLVNDHSILLNEFQVLLDGDREEDLACIFRLFSLIHGGLDSLRQTFETHVRKTGLAAVDRVTSSGENVDPKTYVNALLGVYFRYHHLANVAFAAKPEFLRSLDNACREFVNANKISKPGSGRSAELLAKYVHTLLRKSTKAPDEFELENKLTEVMTVFNYVEDKDIFKDFYARMLAKRILHENSISSDAETSMISKLNIACGFEYTNKLRRMFQDIQTSKPFKAEFKAFQDKMLDVDDKKQPNDLGFAILDTGSWPLGPPRTFFTPPTEILKVTERFQSYYVDMHNGRKLTWLWHLCKGEMCATYIKSSKIPYTFQVSTYQMAILLLFNDEDIIDYEKIFDATSLNKKILDPTLQILLTANVLLSEPKEATFQKGNKFSLNMNFKSKKIKINLNIALKSEQKQEVEHFQKKIQEDRSLLTQSTIVRIMKSRKKMKYTNIVQETIQQVKTRFPLKIADIKKNIDILLEKEYLERGEGEEISYLGAGLPQQHNKSNGQERFWEATERKSVISDDFETGQFPSNTVPEYLPLRTVEKQWSIYRPLKDPDEIRLIELWPGELCNEYKLIHTTLSACRSSHGYRYTALSYVWGDSNKTTMAIVDGKPLSITVSLNSALQNIRPRPDREVVYLWADAISINQQDIVERTHQVRQMASIYSCAEKTIIYLFDYAPLAYGLWELRKTSRSASHVKSIVRPILSHPWFTRIWVLQELITSPNPQVQCGHQWESWDSICKILDLKVSDTEDGSHGKRDRTVKDCFQDANLNSDLDVQKWLAVSSWDSAPHSRTASEYLEALQNYTGPTDAQEILESHLANTDTDEEHKNAFRGLLLLSEMEDLRSARQSTLGIQERDHYLLKVLQFRRGLGVSDPRDMLFAHTKMVSVDHLDKMVDYASSCKTVYEGFARYLIDEIAGLRLLSFVEDIELEERHGNLIIPGQSNSTEASSHETIASWAPNWKITTPDHQSQYLRNVVLNSLNPDAREQLRKMWSHNLSSNRVWLFDGSVLGCIGVLIDFTDDNTESTQPNNSKHHAHITNDQISSHIQKRDLLLPESYRSQDVLCFIADAPESIHVLRPYSTPEGLPINHAHQYFERKRSGSDYSGSHSYLAEKPISVYGLEIRHYKYIGQCFVEGLENSKIHKEMERGQKVIIAIH